MGDQIGANVPWFVYRLYDQDGRLLYCGATNNLERRLREHGRSRWWREVAKKEVEEFPCRWRATLAERVAGPGEHGWLRAGIGKGLAATMTDADLMEALEHPAYARTSEVAISQKWGVRVAKIRIMRQIIRARL